MKVITLKTDIDSDTQILGPFEDPETKMLLLEEVSYLLQEGYDFTQLIISFIEMTEKELDALPEFNGY